MFFSMVLGLHKVLKKWISTRLMIMSMLDIVTICYYINELYSNTITVWCGVIPQLHDSSHYIHTQTDSKSEMFVHSFLTHSTY